MGIRDWFKTPEQRRQDEEFIKQIQEDAKERSHDIQIYQNLILSEQKKVYSAALTSLSKKTELLEQINDLIQKRSAMELRREFIIGDIRMKTNRIESYVKFESMGMKGMGEKIEQQKNDISDLNNKVVEIDEQINAVKQQLKQLGIEKDSDIHSL